MKRRVRIGRNTIEVERTVLDRAIEYIDPIRGAARTRARFATAMANAYTGAAHDRRATKEWKVSGGDADADTLFDLETLRERSRDLIRNQPLASGALNTKVRYVVGGGLHLHPRIDRTVLGLTDAQAETIEDQLKREFDAWANSPECDYEQTLIFADQTALAWRSTLENGDVFALLPMLERPGSPYALKVQLVEADRVCNPQFRQNDRKMAGGIEKDERTGAPVAVHILKDHPGAQQARRGEWERVPIYGTESGRRQVLHLFRKLRIGQTRGVPDLAPVIELFKQLGRYTDAEIMAAVVNAMLTVFIETGSGTTGLGPMSPIAETGGKAGDDDVKLAAGAIVELKAGEKISSVVPTRPNSQFDPFVLAIIRQIAVSLELPYEVVIMHFTSSYSASRAALNEAWRFVRTSREWLARNFCQPVYEAFVTEAVMRGRIGLPGFLLGDAVVRRAYLGARWLGPGRGQIDEKKEVEAATLRMEANLSTLADETAEMSGGDWEANLAQRAREKARTKEFGLEPPKPAVPGAAPSPDPADNPDETIDDEEVA